VNAMTPSDKITPSDLERWRALGACAEGLEWSAEPDRTRDEVLERYAEWLLALDPWAALAYAQPRLSPEQFARAVERAPWAALGMLISE